MARPRLSKGEKRTNRLPVRFTDAEYQILQERAADAGYAELAAYLRDLGLGNDPETKRRPKADKSIRQVSAVLRNLDQLVTATGDELAERTQKRVLAIYKKLLKQDTITSISSANIEHLRAEGTALNRLARRANMGKEIPPEDMQECLSHIQQIFRWMDGEAHQSRTGNNKKGGAK